MFRAALSKIVARGCTLVVAQQQNEVALMQRVIPQTLRCISTSSNPLRSEADKSDGPIDLDKPQVREKGSPKVKELAGEIVNLTLLEVNDLVEILQEKLNLPPATGMPMGGMMGMGGGMGGGGALAHRRCTFSTLHQFQRSGVVAPLFVQYDWETRRRHFVVPGFTSSGG